MVRVKDPEIGIRNYVKNSLKAFLEGGKYSKDRKAKTLNWITGVIRGSGISKEALAEIFNQLRDYPQNEEEKSRLSQIFEESQKQGCL